MATKTMKELFLEELEAEIPATRKTLERVPEGRNDWKPHAKSMPLGYLSALVATMPAWVALTINQDEFDVNPPGRKEGTNQPAKTNRELLQMFDDAIKQARQALENTTDEHLMTRWRLLAGGQVVQEQPRYSMLRTGVLNHWAHHRGQLTVYLRLNEAPVPSIYGPSADENRFAPAGA
jgi:uncharacterized damage-inducible protein DinB